MNGVFAPAGLALDLTIDPLSAGPDCSTWNKIAPYQPSECSTWNKSTRCPKNQIVPRGTIWPSRRKAWNTFHAEQSAGEATQQRPTRAPGFPLLDRMYQNCSTWNNLAESPISRAISFPHFHHRPQAGMASTHPRDYTSNLPGICEIALRIRSVRRKFSTESRVLHRVKLLSFPTPSG